MYVATVGFFNVIGQLLLFDFSVDVIGQLANRVRRHHASFWVGAAPILTHARAKHATKMESDTL